jgi:ATP-dependent Lhr-like helicase
MRIAELCQLVAHQPHLERAAVESILDELGARGYLQRHGFKNMYGADQRAYRLVDYRQIYGNLPAGETMVEVRHGSRVLGEVPAANIFFLDRGAFVRFAGRVWRIQKLSPEVIELEPAEQHGPVQDFRYFSRGVRLDPFVTGRMWDLLHSDSWPPGLFTQALAERMNEVKRAFGAACGPHQLPYVRTPEGYRYLTFAGDLVNRAIAAYARDPQIEVDAISLKTCLPISWSSIPTDPASYLSVLDDAFRDKGEQSLFQVLLPEELQRREKMQQWTRDVHICEVLERLRASQPVRVEQSVVAPFLGTIP